MNPLGNKNINSGLSPEIMKNIQEVKEIMGIFKRNPQSIIQQNPMLNQIMQMCNGKNPELLFKSMCKKEGIDADAFINALKN